MVSPGVLLYERYKILKILGKGRVGETYLAQDQKLPGQPLCVVRLFKSEHVDERIFKLFGAEANLWKRLGQHSQIPQFLAYFSNKQGFFVVEEYIEGHSLREEIRPGQQLNEAYVLQMLHDVLQILVFVHQNHVIHRDIKPEHIIRKPNGKLALIGLGAVKELGTITINSIGQIKTTVAIGTAGYMPIEQVRGKPRLCSDVYAVGMMAIEALTGIHPDTLPNDPHTGEVQWHDQAQVSDQLAAVLDEMVRESCHRRYPSAIEALHDVSELLAV